MLLATLFAALSVVPLAAGMASAQEAGDTPGGASDQYEEEPVPGGLADLERLGIDGPEDFDYCDEEGCHILGPSGKEFFFCDPEWNCEYVLWESELLSAEDFDYLEVQGEDERYGETGVGYVCGSGEVCLNVAGYDCDASGNCEYYTALEAKQYAGGEDAVPDAGEDARRALEGLARALERDPSSRIRPALAAESGVSGGAPPVSGGRLEGGSAGAGGSNASGGSGGRGGSDEENGGSAGADRPGGAGRSGDAGSDGDGDGAASGDAADSGGPGGEAGGAAGTGEGNGGQSGERAGTGEGDGGEGGEGEEQADAGVANGGNGGDGADDSGSAGGGDAASGDAASGDAASGDAGSAASGGSTAEIASASVPYVALGIGVLVLLAGGVVVVTRRLW